MQMLLKQGYIAAEVIATKLYGRHHDLADRYEISLS